MKIFLVNLWYRFCNNVIQLIKGAFFKAPQNPQKILVFRTGSLGDSICAFPAITSIRNNYPDATLHILTNAGRENLVSIAKLLDPTYYDRIIDYFGFSKKELIRLLKKEKYDAIIQLPQNMAPFRSLIRDMCLFRFVIGIRTGFGWSYNTVRFFRREQEKKLTFIDERSRLLGLLEKEGLKVTAGIFPLNFNESDQGVVKKLLAESAVPHRKNIAMAIGAKRSQNRWPLDYYRQVAESLSGEYNVLLIGGKEDREIADRLTTLSGVFNFCGQLTPLQSAWLLRSCFLTITNDSGPMHLSYASGTPVVAIFSSRDFPGKWFPPDNGRNRTLRTGEVHCSLCLSETCANNICMQMIKPEEVLANVREMEVILETEA